MKAILLEGNDDLSVVLPIIFRRAGITLQVVRTEEELLASVGRLHQDDFLLIDCSSGELADIERCARVLRATQIEVHVLYPQAEAVAPLRVIARGRLMLQPADARILTLLAKLRQRWQHTSVARQPVERAPLSQREMDVLRMASQGQTEAAIAAELDIHVSTVKTYMLRVREKWGLTTADAVRAYRLLSTD